VIDQEVASIVRTRNGSSAQDDMLKSWMSIQKLHKKEHGKII